MDNGFERFVFSYFEMVKFAKLTMEEILKKKNDEDYSSCNLKHCYKEMKRHFKCFESFIEDDISDEQNDLIGQNIFLETYFDSQYIDEVKRFLKYIKARNYNMEINY